MGYMTVEEQSSTLLHLKRSPGIRSWSLLHLLAWQLRITTASCGNSSTWPAVCLWLCRTWRNGRRPYGAQGKVNTGLK
uniref:Cytochrome b-245 chaperone 1 n=1 Tax=Amphilophus citrinellus TaxID=61819 RepID=A0A3Q0SR83_AMPCI